MKRLWKRILAVMLVAALCLAPAAQALTTDANAKKAVRQLQKLRGCEAHTTVILSEADEDSFRRLGVRLTSEPKYQTSKLYHG